MKIALFFSLLFVTMASHAQLVYKDVASIFYARCTSCHNQESHGPSYINYTSTSQWTTEIQANVMMDRMPPWTPDTNYTRFIHENKILPSEKAAILNWIATGSQKGDTTKAPLPPVYSQYKLNGKPDLQLKMPPFASNAGLNDSYVCFSLPMGLTTDRILRAYEIIAGDPSIVHHVVVNIDTNGTTSNDLSGNCFNITGDYSIGGFAPGTPPTVFPGSAPLKMGIRIKAGSKLVMQVHYPAGTIGKADSTKIRLYFYPVNETGVRPVLVSTPLQNWNIMVPAATTKTFTAFYPSTGFPSPLSVFATFPHSHKTATKILSYAYKPSDTIPLIRINRWDFDQQGYYTFRKMVKIPAGHRLFTKHVYTNTGTTTVYAGTNTTDEMLFDSFQWMSYMPGDENIDIDALLASDTLLKMPTNIKNVSAGPGLRVYAYPNPFNKSIKMSFGLDYEAEVKLEIYSMLGQKIKVFSDGSLDKGIHEFTWDGTNGSGHDVSAGTYMYVLKAGNKQFTGKIVLSEK